MSTRLQRSHRLASVALAFILTITAVIALAWSGNKLLNQDEMFVLQTDTVPTAAQLLNIQLHTSISLDPPVYHLLAHAATRVFGPTPLALRLPSLAGYLLMQLCLFLYVCRAAGERAGLLAAALPTITATLYYAAEARPYGLLLGLFALTLVAYQSATREIDESARFHTSVQRSRVRALFLLAVAIALTLNTHYFGILLLVPVYAAELTRTFICRRLDKQVATAILVGTATFSFTIPFQRAAAAFHVHYYNLANTGPRAITQAYRSLFVDYTQASLHIQRIVAIVFVLLTFCFLTALALRWRSFHLPPGEAAFLLALSALPFFGYLLAHFVTHSIEVRYVLGAVVAIVVLVALLAEPLLKSTSTSALTMVSVTLAILYAGALHIHAEARKSQSILRSIELPTALQNAMHDDPSRRLYFQEVGHFEIAQYYTPDPSIRARITLVYSADREIRFDRHDTEALTAERLSHFSTLPIVPYDTLLADPSPHLFVLYQGGWDWTSQAFSEDHAVVVPLILWFEGQTAVVKFPSSHH